MDIINSILAAIVGLLDKLLPSIGIPPEFLSKVDEAISWIIGIVQGAGYIIPLDTFVLCMLSMFVVDNWTLVFRVGQWILKIVRG